MAGPYAEGRQAIQSRLFAAQEQPHRMQEYLQMQQQRQQQMQDQAQQRQMQAQETLRQRALEDTTRRQAGEGAAAFAGYMKNPEMMQPKIPGASTGIQSATEALRNAGAPNVGLVPQLPKPEMAPLKLQNVVSSIQKQNPKISPEGLLSALEKFQPYFDAQDRRDLVTMKATTTGAGGNKIENLVYQDAIAHGASPLEAAMEAARYKRAAPDEVGLAAEAKGRAKTEIAREGDFTKVESALKGFEQDSKLVVDTLDKAMALSANPMAAGWGSLTSFVPNSPAGKLKGYLDTIKANLGFDKLQTMRDNSPTGAALGPVSDFENRLLQATKGALDPAQAELLAENLKIIKDLYPIVLAEKRRAFQQDYGNVKKPGGAAPAAPAPAARTINFNDLPE